MTDEKIHGLQIDIIPATLLVNKGQMCSDHHKPIHVVTTMEGREPHPACIDCVVDVVTALVDLAIEATAELALTNG